MRIAFLGDIALVGKYDLRSNESACHRLQALRDYLLGFDLVVANLESPFTTKTRSWVPKSMHLRSNPVNVKLLEFLGIGAVSLANNHVNDFGRRGVDETIAALEAHGIQWFGVDGRSVTISGGDARVTLSGFCCLTTNGTGYQTSDPSGIAVLTREALVTRLEADREADSFSVFSCHWGQEHTHLPNPEHIALVRSLAGSGPFVVHGHHPHVIQGVEQFGDSLVAYSLGNCLFDDLRSIAGGWTLRQSPENRKSFVLAVEIIDGAIASSEAVGFEDAEAGIRFCDIENLMTDYNQGLNEARDPERYESLRAQQVSAARGDKFGPRDLRWLLSRLNYHSIGSRLAAAPRRWRYRAVREGFSHG